MKLHSWHDPHIIRTGKSLLKAVYLTVGVFLFLFVTFHIGGALYISSIETKSSDAFNFGIVHDLAYLKEQGDAVAKNDLVQKYLITQDSQKMIEVLQAEKDKRSIGLMGVTNSEGISVGRTKTPGKLGDNIFLMNPVGRIVAQGKYAQSVETPVGFDPHQLFLNTGRPIMQGDHMIGALFANYLTDDIYAKRFRDTYLPHGVEVVFYNKNAGVYGDSFSDEETRKLINSYFNSGSDWISNGDSGKTVSFKDGNFYLIKNIVFPGLEQSPGGALIFIPRRDISTILNLTITFLTLCTFLFFAIRNHMRSRNEEHGWRYYTLLVSISIPVVILALFSLHIENIEYSKLVRVPYTLYNSTMRIKPDFGIYDMGFEQRFSIVVDTGDEAINTISVGLLFDPEAVDVKAIEIVNSTCSYVIENTINTSTGEATISCVVLKSEGERGSLTVANVVVVPRHPGTFTLSFDKENTQVLASDGLGTNVLRMAQSGSYRVDTFDKNLFTTTSTTLTKRSFVVFSPTHPNQSRWYKSSIARFVWIGKPNAVYSYEFDSLPNTIPSKKHTIQGSVIDIPIPGDGVFYFHLQLVGGGPIAHYRLQADETSPSIVSIHLSTEKVVVGDVVRFSFEAQDTGSGIQQNYYVNLGNHLFLPTGSQLYVPFLESGDQKIILRVYDTAGNFSEKSQVVHVDSR